MSKYILAALLVGALSIGGIVFAADNPLHGKIIALDAGHGSTYSDFGAQYPAGCADDGDTTNCRIYEKDVNLAVVNALESKLAVLGAKVVIAERLSTRRDRVNDAVAKCAALDVDANGVADNRKCDVLVSVHHNGNTDPTHDGTLSIYTQNSDKPLAKGLYDSLLPLTQKPEGMLNGGYGMTVYKNLVSAITEAYYITNDAKASRYLNDLNAEGVSNLVLEEANAQVKGISDYFYLASQTGGKGGKR